MITTLKSNSRFRIKSENDVFKDVEKSYKAGGKIVKDFIKVGLDFVMDHPDADKLELNFKQADKNVEIKPYTRCKVATSEVDSLAILSSDSNTHQEDTPEQKETPVVNNKTAGKKKKKKSREKRTC